MIAIQLWEAVRSNDRVATNRIIAQITPMLVAYLTTQMSASYEDAREVVQNTMLYICDGIRSSRIHKDPGLYSYMQKTCRHTYLKVIEGRRRTPTFDSMVREIATESEDEQLEELLQKEKEVILQLCVSEMREDNQDFFHFLMANPGMPADLLGERFGMSASAVWARKHRVISFLKRCTSKRLDQ